MLFPRKVATKTDAWRGLERLGKQDSSTIKCKRESLRDEADI